METPKESWGPERRRLNRRVLIRELMDKLNLTESEEERKAMIHEYLQEAIELMPHGLSD